MYLFGISVETVKLSTENEDKKFRRHRIKFSELNGKKEKLIHAGPKELKPRSS